MVSAEAVRATLTSFSGRFEPPQEISEQPLHHPALKSFQPPPLVVCTTRPAPLRACARVPLPEIEQVVGYSLPSRGRGRQFP